jgi:hypothetical protein
MASARETIFPENFCIESRGERTVMQDMVGQKSHSFDRAELVGTVVTHDPVMIDEVVWPRDRFVAYEKSDEVWAVPLGYAKVIRRAVRFGDLVNIDHVCPQELYCGDVMVVRNQCRKENRDYGRNMVWELEFVVVAWPKNLQVRRG